MSSSEATNADTSATPGFIGGFMEKYGVQMNMKTGLIIMAVILVIAYFAYSYVYPKFVNTEGMEGDNDKKTKKKKGDKGDAKDENKEETKKEISNLVDKIEVKQEKNLSKESNKK